MGSSILVNISRIGQITIYIIQIFVDHVDLIFFVVIRARGGFPGCFSRNRTREGLRWQNWMNNRRAVGMLNSHDQK